MVWWKLDSVVINLRQTVQSIFKKFMIFDENEHLMILLRLGETQTPS